MGYLIAKDQQTRVGHALIDNDHLHLHNLVNDLIGVMKLESKNGAIEKLSDELIGFAQEHFEQEEELMQRILYADFAAHKRAHDELIGELLAFRATIICANAPAIERVSMFLDRWLDQHIHRHDMRLGAALNQAKFENS